MRSTGLIALFALSASALAPVQAQHSGVTSQVAADLVARDATTFATDWQARRGILGEFTAHTVAALTDGETRLNLPQLRDAASWGDADAKAALGLYHLTTAGAGYDPEAAFAYNISAARAGVPVAQTNVGLQYLNGVGVKTNHTEALRWFETAAIRGHSESAFRTGVMYLEGDGVKSNPTLARYYLLKARAKGDRRADQILRTF